MSNIPFKSSSHISTSSEWKSEITTVNNVDVRVYEPVDTSTPVIITAPQFSVGGDPTFSVNKIKRTVDEILLDNIHAPVTCQALLSCTASGEIVQTHSSGYHLLPVSGQKIYEYLSTNFTGGGGGGGGGGSSYITLEPTGSTPTTYYPMGNPGPSFSAPDLSLKLIGNLRLEKDPTVAASGSLLVEDRLDILGPSTYTSPAGSNGSMYAFSGFNHPVGALFGMTRLNIFVGEGNIIQSDLNTQVKADNDLEMEGKNKVKIRTNDTIFVDHGDSNGSTPLPSTGFFSFYHRVGGYDQNNNGIQQAGNYTVEAGSTVGIYSPQITIGSTGGWGTNQVNKTDSVYIKTKERITTDVGLANGTTPLPSSGYFYNTTRIGGYHQSTGIQQAGIYNVTAGSEAQIFSPNIIIGSTVGWGGTSQVNKTDNVYINAQTNITMSATTHIRYGSFYIYNGILSVAGPAYAQVFQTTSDDRLKHNEEDLTDCLSVIRKLKPQKYQKTKEMKEADFNGTLTEGEYTVEAGFIAQDIKNDIPELAYSVNSGDSIDKPYSVNYNSIFTHHVAATKELDAIVTNLLAKIATLEARITELENK